MSNTGRKRRAINLPGNDIGKQRQALLRDAYGRINEAIEAGFMLEAITLCESIIADRLEARRAWLHNQAENKRRFGMLAELVNDLQGKGKGSIADNAEEVAPVYEEVLGWAARRNSSLHEMAKLAEGENVTWQTRYAALAKIANEGKKLSRKVGNLVKKLNKPVERKN